MPLASQTGPAMIWNVCASEGSGETAVMAGIKGSQGQLTRRASANARFGARCFHVLLQSWKSVLIFINDLCTLKSVKSTIGWEPVSCWRRSGTSFDTGTRDVECATEKWAGGLKTFA